MSTRLEGRLSVASRLNPPTLSRWSLSIPQNIYEETDGTFIATGNYSVTPGYNEHWMVKLSSDGDVLWKKIIYDGNGRGTHITKTADGNYALLQNGPGHGFSVVKTDSAGTVLWTKKISETHGYITDIYFIQTADGDFVFTGPHINENEPPDIFLSKADSTDAIVYDYERIDGLEVGFTVSPNPAKDWATIRTNGIIDHAAVRFKLYDLSGREIWNKPLKSNQELIQFQMHITAGIYVGTLEIDNKKQIGRIIYLE